VRFCKKPQGSNVLKCTSMWKIRRSWDQSRYNTKGPIGYLHWYAWNTSGNTLKYTCISTTQHIQLNTKIPCSMGVALSGWRFETAFEDLQSEIYVLKTVR